MWKSLREFIDELFAPQGAAQAGAQRSLQLAAAVLLVEVMRADHHLAAPERTVIEAALREQFGLADGEADQLVALAEEASDGASDYFAFTSRINEGYTMEQKLQVIEQMWRVAYADGRLSDHEQHVMRRIADLLYIPQGAYVHAKLRAREAMAPAAAGGPAA